MNKTLIVCALGMLAGCNYFKKEEASSGDAASATSAGGPVTNAPTTIVDKALSFFGSSTPFEGDITMNITPATGTPQTIVYEVKGDKMRFNAPAGGPAGESGYVIFDMSGKKLTTISDSKKTAMVMSMDGANAMAAKAGMAANAPKATVEKGGTDTVAGYSCDIYKISEVSGDKSEACLAKGIRFPSFGKGASASWLGDIGGDGNVFPMRVVTNDPTGKQKEKMEVTKVEKKSLDDATFTVPAGYQTMNMDDMMKSFGGMRGGMPNLANMKR